jgi:hypothetical protein
MMDARNSSAEKAKISRVEVYWHTVRYRTIVAYALVLSVIVLAIVCWASPGFTSRVIRHISDAVTPHDVAVADSAARQARFVNLDGGVQIKKSNSVQWQNADYQITLDKGDLIQTDSRGMARIAFADGTTYTVKGDTLVTVEENNITQDRGTQVAVHISAGQVDLHTGSWTVPNSKAEVSFGDAVASLHANSRAAVSTDPATQQQQITVAEGSAELNRGDQHVDIGQHQRVDFPKGGPFTKSDVLAPPELVGPLNLQPIILDDAKHDSVHFSWKPVLTAKSYVFQASQTTVFNSVVVERKTADTSVDVSGFDPGEYFWRVRAIDAKGNVSEASDPFKFTLVARDKEQGMVLEVDSTEIQGNVIEVIGHTEPGAALIVNGDRVADIQNDGKFRYFTQPMIRGSHEIVITGQNRRGGTAIKRVTVVIP